MTPEIIQSMVFAVQMFAAVYILALAPNTVWFHHLNTFTPTTTIESILTEHRKDNP
jgi:hypothetical protein